MRKYKSRHNTFFQCYLIVFSVACGVFCGIEMLPALVPQSDFISTLYYINSISDCTISSIPQTPDKLIYRVEQYKDAWGDTLSARIENRCLIVESKRYSDKGKYKLLRAKYLLINPFACVKED